MPEEFDQKQNEPFLELNTKSDNDKLASVFYVITIIISILIVGFFVFMKFRGDSISADKQAAYSNLSAELSSSKNKAIETKANDLNSAVSVLATASKSKYLFRAFIDELSTKITNDTKLSNLTIDNSGKMVMDGKSGSYRSVADLAVALGTSSKIKNVQITGLSMGSDAGKERVSFSMTAEIVDWKTAAVKTASTTGGVSE